MEKPGGLIGKIKDGDVITIRVANRSIDISVPGGELAAREGGGYVVGALGYLANFREIVRPLDTSGSALARDRLSAAPTKARRVRCRRLSSRVAAPGYGRSRPRPADIARDPARRRRR